MHIIFIVIALSIYICANYYIGIRSYNALNSIIPRIRKKLYWSIFSVPGITYFTAVALKGHLTGSINTVLYCIGGYWIAALIYLTILFGLSDLIHNFMRGKKFAKVNLGIIMLVILTLVYGTIHADDTRIVRYDIDVNKSMGNVKELNIAMVSDIHIGRVIGKKKVERMVSTINSMKPDVILLAGDIVDYEAQTYISEDMTQTFKKLKSAYGIYGVLGNHEYISGEPEKLQKLYEESGINLLKDDIKYVNNDFYVVGRDDASAEGFLGIKRKPLSQILKGVDSSKLILMMDHQPVDYNEAERSGVDIMVSGHTHRGQFFPGNIFTHIMFKIDWGHLKLNNLNAIVSSGFGTWGPPIRIGTNSEIVRIVVHFKGG